MAQVMRKIANQLYNILIQLARCLVFEAADYLVQLYSSHETANEWYNAFQINKQGITIARVR